ncbi:MAG: glutamate--tRNA ligase [Nitrospirae bacterium]|nr:glutamate--tRNA ligase [Nitrospirota bacterium]
MNIRTRFAPSPTGFLHIGGARTALYSWLFARKHGGKFVLRIEDTDRERSKPEFEHDIIESLKWLGLDWDEGPFRQTERFDVYREFAKKLEQAGALYRCTCSAAELDERRKQAMKEGRPPQYDGRCRSRTDQTDKPYALRFKMPKEGETVVKDLVLGEVRFANRELEDLIILRSNGIPTYNFTVVVDDAEHGISHVIRGNDHLNNTPKQIHMFKALGLESPQFAHLPLILGTDRSRLSKRHGAVSVTAYKEEGFLPEPFLNFLARIGWSHGDQEEFTLEELKEKFGLDGVGKTSGAFNEDKLIWLNSQYINRMNGSVEGKEKLRAALQPFLAKAVGEAGNPAGIPGDQAAWWTQALGAFGQRADTLKVLADSMAFLFQEEVRWDDKAKKKFLQPGVLEVLERLCRKLDEMESFSDLALLESLFKGICSDNDPPLQMGQLAQPVRVALTGKSVSPGIFDVLQLLGKEKSLARLRAALSEIRAGVADRSLE